MKRAFLASTLILLMLFPVFMPITSVSGEADTVVRATIITEPSYHADYNYYNFEIVIEDIIQAPPGAQFSESPHIWLGFLACNGPVHSSSEG